MEKKQEIVPLNRELYTDLSIEELEQRLELGCWVYVCSECGTQCGAYCTGLCGAECPTLCGYNGGGGGGGE